MGKHIFFFREHEPHTGIYSQWYPHSFQARICLPPIPETANATRVSYPAGSSSTTTQPTPSTPNPVDPSDSTTYPTLTFSCTEQYMMYHKALLAQDSHSALAILKTKEPRKQKALGRAVENLPVEEWDRVKFRVVCEGNYAKFTYMPEGEKQKKECREMREALLGTGEKMLCEASPFDPIWGVGLKAEDARYVPEENWHGTNLLGKALMRVRERLRREEAGEAVEGDWTAGGDA